MKTYPTGAVRLKIWNSDTLPQALNFVVGENVVGDKEPDTGLRLGLLLGREVGSVEGGLLGVTDGRLDGVLVGVLDGRKVG